MTKIITPLTPTTIRRHEVAIYSSLAMLAGMQLDVFTPLRDGPLTSAEIAAAIAVREDKLAPLLYALINAELLTLDGSRFSNTAEANEFLVRGKPRYLGSAHELYAQQWQQTSHTAASIRAGAPQARLTFEAASLDELRPLYRGFHAGAVAAGRNLALLIDMSRSSHLADIGGGSGGLAIGACQVCPELRATVVDLPNIAPVAPGFIAEAGLADRIGSLGANVVAAPLPGHFDAAVLKAFIQVLSPGDARAALRHVGEAMVPGGRIFILGRMLDDTRLSPRDTVGQNLLFLNIYDDGQAYTERNHRDWLTEAGFDDITVTFEGLPGGISLVSAHKRTVA